VKNGRDKRFLLGERRFFFDDGGQDHCFPLRDSQFRCALREVGAEDFLELTDHHLDRFLRVHFPDQVIAVGEEVALQGRPCELREAKSVDECRGRCLLEEFFSLHDIRIFQQLGDL